ncbi:MAG: hypothetical protein ACJ786_30255 [Catenulispora sp.]
MNFRRLFPGLYWLACGGCGRRRLRLGYSAAVAMAYDHDDRCEVLCARRADNHVGLIMRRAWESWGRRAIEAEIEAHASELRASAAARQAAESVATAGGWDAAGIEHDAAEGRVERHPDGCHGCTLLAKTIRWGSLVTPELHDATTPSNNL